MNLDGYWDNKNLTQNDESNLDKDIIEEEEGVKTFRVKNYIPKRSTNHKKFLESPHIIGTAIIFILIIIIIILASLKNKSIVWICPNATATQEVILNVSGKIILLDKNRFFIYDPHTASLKLLLEVKSPVQSFDIGRRKTLFWIEANSWKIMSLQQSRNETEKDINLIFDEIRTKPFAIAIDSINNNLYIVDETSQGLIVINVDTKYYTLILRDLISLRYIVLDAAKRIMFIASTKEIQRAEMDGSNLVRIVNNKFISGITLDPEGEKIFWINNYEFIETCDYSGRFVKQLLVDLVPILDLTILDDYLFWIRESSENQNATLWSCKIQNGTCDDHEMLSNAVSTSTLMRVTDRIRYNSSQQNTLNRQKCEHISLPTPSGQMTCACNMSSQLIFNKKCEPVTQFVLYIFNNVIRSRTLDISQRIASEPFWPTPYHVRSLSFKTVIDFDYDFENDDFYFSDDKTIYKIKLKAKNPQQEIVLASTSDVSYIEDLAYDWLTGNMYYSNRSELAAGKHSLVVFNVKKGPHVQKILKYFDYDISFGMEASAYGLAVYPSRGRLFFTAGENGRRYIYQTTMNGTVITKFTNVLYVHNYRLIAVDFDKDRLYWISSDMSVTYANFDGSNRKEIMSAKIRTPKTISVCRQWMYLSDFDRVWRVNKETGDDYSHIAPPNNALSKVSGARIINQAQVFGNPCRKNNGGCEQFCFYGSNATCDCADGLRVTNEGACK